MSEEEQSSEGQQRIPIASLNLQQLSSLKQQLEEELKTLTQSFSQLRMAQERFQTSKSCLGHVSKAEEGTDILVPMTPTLYVPGSLSSNNSVLVDIGTGYYAQKDIEGAESYMDRKVNYLNERINDVQKQVESKRTAYEQTTQILSEKAKEQQASGNQQQ
eukprot:gb/GECH01011860.1/.p1 GENE.gb/GECH01011860.1/~~gb/GECH01011860.1/.p1  ORF type:complete len:160 (+),score=43.52 gb/GECH01011860.1/:1-480(+)